MSAETALALLIVALFALDSLRLLRADEALLVASVFAPGSGPWRAEFGARNFKLAGREPHLAHLLLPHRVAYRLAWRMDHMRWLEGSPAAAATAGAADGVAGASAGASAGATASTADAARLEPLPTLRRLGVNAWISWALVLIVIPGMLLAGWGIVPALVAVLLLYVNTVLALLLTFRWRQGLGLSARAFALLAFECLACAPYSANLLRRIAWQQAVGEDFYDAASRLLPAEGFVLIQRECLARIEERLEAEPEQSELALRLRAAHTRLAALIASATLATDRAR